MLPPGKLPHDLLDRLLRSHTDSDPSVIVGPRVGEDATVIDLGDVWLVAKSDPITFATADIGRYAVHVNANDIATMGATPRWFLATILLPDAGADETLVESIFRSVHEAAAEIGVAVCGGHTEVTVGLDRPIVSGQMLGTVDKDSLVLSSGLSPGDSILLTKGLAVEATAILAGEKRAALAAAGVASNLIEDGARYLIDPGISVLKEARIACGTARVTAMHDPTEGGVATALMELAAASEVGMEIDADALPVSETTGAICHALDVDPLGFISSGALLIGTSSGDTAAVREAIEAEGIRCARIGTVTERKALRMMREGKWQALPQFARDEIARLEDKQKAEGREQR